MRRVAIGTALVLLAASLNASPIVKFKTAVGEAQGYLATPAKDSGKHPAIIVIQEWWGVNDWVKDQAKRFAGQGDVALAVDLYHGKVATTPEQAHELMRGLPEDRVMADLEGAFDYLASRKDVDPKRIGVIGWCMGGGYALMLAAHEPRLAAGAVNYGHLMVDPRTIASIKVPLLGNFGADDGGIPAADVRQFESALKKAGKEADFKIYPGAGHAFMNPNNKSGYVATAASDAWKRIDSFFARHLRANMPNS